MQIIEGDLRQEPFLEFPLAITLGNFDGVHSGHRYLIKQLVSHAQSMGVASAVLSFHPHPAEVFAKPGFRYLLSKEDRIARLAELGLDVCVLQDFSSDFADMSAEDFLRQYLCDSFNLRLVFLGYDYRFGQGGRGNFEMAQGILSERQIDVIQAAAYQEQGETVSSSLIRESLTRGDIAEANRRLGYPYCLSGEVCRGDQLGRTLGFPTANLSKIKTQVPGGGVYSSLALVGGHWLPSVVNIGHRPTLKGKELRIECHVIGFHGDLYGQRLQIRFQSRIRSEQKFKNIEKLKERIALDVLEATQELAGDHG